jgi:hypothetical protein
MGSKIKNNEIQQKMVKKDKNLIDMFSKGERNSLVNMIRF